MGETLHLSNKHDDVSAQHAPNGFYQAWGWRLSAVNYTNKKEETNKND